MSFTVLEPGLSYEFGRGGSVLSLNNLETQCLLYFTVYTSQNAHAFWEKSQSTQWHFTVTQQML